MEDLKAACEILGIFSSRDLMALRQRADEGDKAIAALHADTVAAAKAALGPGANLAIPVAGVGALLATRDYYRDMAAGNPAAAVASPSAVSAAQPTAGDMWARLTEAQRSTGLKMGMKTAEEQERFASEVFKQRGAAA